MPGLSLSSIGELLDILPDAVVMVDAGSIIVYCNQAVESLLGYAPVELQGQPLTVLLPAILIWMLGFEVASSFWKVQTDYLMATTQGEYLLDGLRWIGWLPFAALFLWVRERLVLRNARLARSPQ